MNVHPQIAAALQAMEEADLPAIESLDPAGARALLDGISRARESEPAEVKAVEMRTAPGPLGDIPLRVYWPKADGPHGVVVFFHGGGHVIGSLDSHDAIARNLCAGAEAVVVSVDYRMGPEHRFPAPVDDCWAAVQWVHANAADLGADADRIAVAGDSAGGNLAAVIALMARDAGGPELKLQVLVYPVTDYGFSGESYKTYAKGYGLLTDKAMLWFRDHYLNDATEAADWRASPLLAGRLDGLAPALAVVAGCDVLCDDGDRYAAALHAAGSPVEHVKYDGMIHGFFGMAPDVDDAVAAQALVCARLRDAFKR